MSEVSASAPALPRPGEISLVFLVGALLTGHIMSSMALLVLPALAPEVAREYSIDASLIGYFIVLVCAGQLVTLTLFSSVTRRFGACRINQAGHSCVAAAMLSMMLPSPAFLAVGALLIGFGYGLIGPSFSHLLMRFSPPERRNLIFSLQQTGVPIGGIAAALVAPAVALAFGWRWMFVLTGLAGIVVAVGWYLVYRNRAEVALTPEETAHLDIERLRTIVPLAVRMMDNVIDISKFPLPQQEHEAKAKRRIGLGVTGLADALLMCGVRYGSPRAVELTREWMGAVQYLSYMASSDIAAEKGSFPLFKRDRYLAGETIKALPEDVRDSIGRYGIRNALLNSIAPTGTISLLADNVSSGIEPVFAFAHVRHVLQPDGTRAPVPMLTPPITLAPEPMKMSSPSTGNWPRFSPMTTLLSIQTLRPPRTAELTTTPTG